MLWIGIALIAGSIVLNVISVRIRRRGQAQPAPAPASVALDKVLDSDAEAEIDGLIENGELIKAIKVLRERTGWGLADAKRWVDKRAGR